jgi:hypothetical protein
MISIDVLANYSFVFFQEGDKMQKMSVLVNLQVIDNIDLIGAHCIIIDSRTGYPTISGCQGVLPFYNNNFQFTPINRDFFFMKRFIVIV